MDKNLNQAVIQATEEMFDSVVGWKVKSLPPVEETLNGSSAETSVIISFVGNISGAFVLKCTKACAVDIASQMLGMDVSDDSEDLKDAMGEMMNMIAGRAKTDYAEGNESFKISVPTTIVGEDYVVHIKANNGDAISSIGFKCQQHELSIEVYVK